MNSIFTGPVKFLALIGLCLPSSAMAEDGKPPRPNIIVILADDLGYGDISAFGSQVIDTPNIDRLAKEGVTMTSWYAAQNVCTPSRAGLLTGRYAPRSGTQFVTRPHSTWGMAPGEVTIAEMLKDAGYATGMIGKWHLGHRLKFWPTNQGFESFLGVAYSNDMQPFDLYRGTVMVEKDIDQSRLTDKYAAEAARFIRVNKDRPFFLYYSSSFPHYRRSRHSAISAARRLVTMVIQ
jgi:arylsulfatase A